MSLLGSTVRDVMVPSLIPISRSVKCGGAQGDVAVEGWAWDKLRRRSVGRIVLVDKDRMIAGLGSGGQFRPDFRSLPGVEHADPGRKGFVPSVGAAEIRPYAILDHGKIACSGH